MAFLITMLLDYMDVNHKHKHKFDDYMPGRKLAKPMTQLQMGDTVRGWVAATGKNISVVH